MQIDPILRVSLNSLLNMDYRPLVSVMIPFHNAAGTLQRCLNSVLALSYRPLEIILVDDASTDGGADMIKAYIEENKDLNLRIRILTHAVNKGVAAARDLALSEAEGEYITAVDADDFIDPQAIDEYVKATDGGRADIVAAGVVYEYEGRQVPKSFKRGERLSLDEVRIDSLHFLLTNKLMRTRVLRSVTPFIPGQNCWEDLGAVSRMLAIGAETVVLSDAFYHYVQENEGSLTGSDPDKILHQHIAVAASLEDWLSRRGLAGRNRQFLTYLKFIAKVKWLRNPAELRRHPIRRLRSWRDTFQEVNAHIMGLKKVKLRYRLIFKTAHVLSRFV